MSKIENLEKLFLEQLQDAYDAEHQLVEALGELEGKATSPQLKRAFADHRKETERQVQKLERVFKGMGEKAERKTCKAMKGLVSEGSEMVKATGDEAAIDAGLIAAAQKVEHYEMATYGTLRTFAQQLGRQQEARLLQEILDEESAANEKLTALATSGINQRAEDGDERSSGLDSMLRTLGLGGRAKQGSGQRAQAKSNGASNSTGRSASKSSSGGTARKSNGNAAAKSSSAKTTATKTTATKSAATKTAGAKGSSAKGSTSSRTAKATARHTARGGSSATNGRERTKEELMEEARRLDIEGRSGMTKAQLERELQKRH